MIISLVSFEDAECLHILKAFDTIAGDALIHRSLSRRDLPGERSTNCSFQMPFSLAIWQGHRSHGLPISINTRAGTKSSYLLVGKPPLQTVSTVKRDVKPASEMVPNDRTSVCSHTCGVPSYQG